jgi:hypothetical protein
MKMKMRAVVTCEWEEDTDNWDDNERPVKTKEELVNLVREFIIDGGDSYLCDVADFTSVTVEAVEELEERSIER